MSAVAAETTRLPELDGVRALAVIGVIASHSGLFGLGWVGVDVFFGLSGYLITGILLDAKVPGVRPGHYFTAFYMRRVLRIIPLAWAYILVMCWLHGDWRGALWYLGYVANWLPEMPPPRVLGHYWSLALEEQFYTLWPAVVFLASRESLRRITLWLLAVGVAFRLGVTLWPPEFATKQWMDFVTPARWDGLLVGAWLAQLERSPGGWRREARWALPVAIVAGAALVAIRLVERGAPMPALTYNLKVPVIAIGVAAGLLWVLTRKPAFLRWPWMLWIGKVSYGVYVIHTAFGDWLHEHFSLQQAPIIFVLQMGFTLPLAALSWYLFEQPLLRLKRHWPMPASSSRTNGPARTPSTPAP